MKLLAHIENRVEILPFFVDHYLSLGVDKFVFGLWRGRENKNWDGIVDIMEDKKVPYVLEKSFDFEVYCGKHDSYYQNFVRKNHIADDEWYVIADLDELQVISPDYRSYDDMAVDLDKEKATFVEGTMVDRITSDGSIPEHLGKDSDIFQQFPVSARVSEKICCACCIKVLVCKGFHNIESGHHSVANGVKFSRKYVTYHFKWFGGVLSTLAERYKNYQKLDLPWKDEPNRAYQHIVRNGGIKITDGLIYCP